MKTITKLEILESLNAMDHAQMEKVSRYIRQVLSQKGTTQHRKIRQLGMEQIQKALQPQQLMRPQF